MPFCLLTRTEKKKKKEKETRRWLGCLSPPSVLSHTASPPLLSVHSRAVRIPTTNEAIPMWGNRGPFLLSSCATGSAANFCPLFSLLPFSLFFFHSLFLPHQPHSFPSHPSITSHHARHHHQPHFCRPAPPGCRQGCRRQPRQERLCLLLRLH